MWKHLLAFLTCYGQLSSSFPVTKETHYVRWTFVGWLGGSRVIHFGFAAGLPWLTSGTSRATFCQVVITAVVVVGIVVVVVTASNI
jgi:hypothetical protein